MGSQEQHPEFPHQFSDATEDSWTLFQWIPGTRIPHLVRRQRHAGPTCQEIDDVQSDLTESIFTTSVHQFLAFFPLEIDTSQVSANLAFEARKIKPILRAMAVLILLVVAGACFSSSRHASRGRRAANEISSAAPSAAPSEDQRNFSVAPTATPNEDQRIETMKKCIAELTGKRFWLDGKDESPQERALNWFIDGAGLLIPAPTDCQWDSEFAMLYVLVVIRESLSVQDSSWYPHQPLHFAAEACSWARVHCDNGKVTKLSFNNAALKGTLAAEMSGLVHLKQLDLFSNNGLDSTIPSELGLLSELESFKIHYTALRGTVPTELGEMKALREFLLHGTLLTGEMPATVCDLHLDALVATCNLIACSCCTKCKS